MEEFNGGLGNNGVNVENGNGVMDMDMEYSDSGGGKCGNGGINQNGGNGGTVGTKMDGGGGVRETGGEPRCGEANLTKRKPLRGKRGLKKNISEMEKRRLAEAMKRWLGKPHAGPEN